LGILGISLRFGGSAELYPIQSEMWLARIAPFVSSRNGKDLFRQQ
jgi:hypothetical protein